MNSTNIKPSNILEKKLETFTLDQKILLFKNTGAIQLTEGCSIGCSDCGAGALKGIRDYIPHPFLEKLFVEYGNCLKNVNSLYFASDPYDYNFDGIKYNNIHKLFLKHTKKNVYVSTSAPKGSEKEILELMIKSNTIEISPGNIQKPVINALSLMKSNYSRLEKAFSEMEGCKIEDQTIVTEYKLNTKFSLINKVDTKENTTYVKIYGNNRSGKLYMIKSDRGNIGSIDNPVTFQDLIDHKKYCATMASMSGRYSTNTSEMTIHDFYSNNPNQNQRLKLGKRFENELSEQSIACFHGVVLTPTGIYNYQAVKPSIANPIGWIKTEITAENFEIIPFKYNNNLWDQKAFYKYGNRRVYGKNKFKDFLSKINIF
ncbi:MAG: hypothetical protein ACP5N1_04210 [Candidatus Woesearchaeota archaeon]